MHSPTRGIAACLLCLALALPGIAAADAPSPKAVIAERKAENLQDSAASDGDGKPPTRAELITPPGVQAVDPAGEAPLDDPITCLARSIYWEARGTEATDMEAVANVVMNRLGSPGFPDTVCGVVKQGSEQGSCQFSWWCDGRADDAREDTAYDTAKEVARKALNGQLKDRTGGALFFHHRNAAPYWSKQFTQTFEAGDFIFYRPEGDCPC
ncbi:MULTISPECIES: cell wall hydrolase [Modicisalibacter]|uniref:cell wall hydrolase n=1 Tax=Modicisalibacter TaxID=574347 RepID=UPI00100BE67D|nr:MULTISPECIES: cell wall hydrolase [Halomonadaceae]MBZ9560124.1 cell wall hydrolase [Modicisalibacter sp. R2A 31.J]MBZ9576032.1 cell wall hydrolase [Modicisalibacter sp. MOD 31.J]